MGKRRQMEISETTGNKVERFKNWCQNHRIVSVVIIIGIIVIAVGAFTEALEKTLRFFKKQTSSVLAKTPKELISSSQDEYSTMTSFYDHLKKLDNRFAEKNKFVKEAIGHAVVWQGLVQGVDEHEDIKSVVIFLADEKDAVLRTAVVYFPMSFKTRVFALKRNDEIRVEGTIRVIEYGTIVGINATNFGVINL
jgi:hypothetical protein